MTFELNEEDVATRLAAAADGLATPRYRFHATIQCWCGFRYRKLMWSREYPTIKNCSELDVPSDCCTDKTGWIAKIENVDVVRT